MYWPVGTPRIYATSSSNPPPLGDGDGATPFHLVVSDDGAHAHSHSRAGSTSGSVISAHETAAKTSSSSLLLSLETAAAASEHSAGGGDGTAAASAHTPVTPLTPAVKPVEHHRDDYYAAGSEEDSDGGGDGHDGHDGQRRRKRRASAAMIPDSIPAAEPILALRVSRRGDVFATITATSMTVWQTKVCAPGSQTTLLPPRFARSARCVTTLG